MLEFCSQFPHLQGSLTEQEQLLGRSCTLYIGNLGYHTTEEQVTAIRLSSSVALADIRTVQPCRRCETRRDGPRSIQKDTGRILLRRVSALATTNDHYSDTIRATTPRTPCATLTACAWTIAQSAPTGTWDSPTGGSLAAADTGDRYAASLVTRHCFGSRRVDSVHSQCGTRVAVLANVNR